MAKAEGHDCVRAEMGGIDFIGGRGGMRFDVDICQDDVSALGGEVLGDF